MWDTWTITYHYAPQPVSMKAHFINTNTMTSLSLFWNLLSPISYSMWWWRNFWPVFNPLGIRCMWYKYYCIILGFDMHCILYNFPKNSQITVAPWTQQIVKPHNFLCHVINFVFVLIFFYFTYFTYLGIHVHSKQPLITMYTRLLNISRMELYLRMLPRNLILIR